jgi:hypothetical protein
MNNEEAKRISKELEKSIAYNYHLRGDTPEIREIDTESPLPEYKVGEDYHYAGEYVHGYEEGTSKIVRFYKDVTFWNGKEEPLKKDNSNFHGIWMQLENGKRILLGFLTYSKFKVADSFKK